MSLTRWDISGCCCTAPGFTQSLSVRGCAAPAKKPSFFAGLAVNVYNVVGGTLLASGTTDATGAVTLLIPGPTGIYYVTAASPWPGRNDAFAQNVNLTGVTLLPIPLPAHAGFACCPNVDWAIPNTLFWSDPDKAVTLTYGAATGWLVAGTWYSMTGTKTPTSGCTPPNPFVCPGTAGNPLIRPNVLCGASNDFSVARQWIEACVTRAYGRGPGTTCTGMQICGATATYDGSGGPPFSFSGALAFTAGGSCTLANPVPGVVTITE